MISPVTSKLTAPDFSTMSWKYLMFMRSRSFFPPRVWHRDTVSIENKRPAEWANASCWYNIWHRLGVPMRGVFKRGKCQKNNHLEHCEEGNQNPWRDCIDSKARHTKHECCCFAICANLLSVKSILHRYWWALITHSVTQATAGWNYSIAPILQDKWLLDCVINQSSSQS